MLSRVKERFSVRLRAIERKARRASFPSAFRCLFLPFSSSDARSNLVAPCLSHFSSPSSSCSRSLSRVRGVVSSRRSLRRCSEHGRMYFEGYHVGRRVRIREKISLFFSLLSFSLSIFNMLYVYSSFLSVRLRLPSSLLSSRHVIR